MTVKALIADYLTGGRLVARRYSRFASHFAVVTIIFCAAAALTAYVPVLLKSTTDTAAVTADSNQFLLCALAYAACWAAAGVLQNIKGIFSAKVLARIDAALNIELLESVLRYDYKSQQKLEVGKVAQEIVRAATSLSAITSSLFWVLAPAALEIVVASLFLAFYINGSFAALFAVCALLLVGLAYFVSLKTQDVHAMIFDAANQSHNYVVEQLSALYDIKINYAVDRQVTLGDSIFQAQVGKIWRANLRMGSYLAMQTAAIGIVLALLTMAPVLAFPTERLGAGNFVLIAGYVGALAGQLRMLCGALMDLQRSHTSLRRGLALVAPESAPLERVNERIAEQVPAFKVRRTSPDSLRELGFDINLNEMTGIRGRSGIGKTTLLNEIFGLVQTSEDSVVAGTHVLAPGIRVRDAASLAPQFPAMLNASLRSNLLFGTDTLVSDAELHHLLEVFWPENAGESTVKLEDPIGRGGRSLSGGEIQRIGLLRAFLRSKRILILDEPTSALDAATSKRIVEFLKKSTPTIIVVSHDDAVLAHCDRVYSLD